jgi:hypothetical protein
MSGWKKKFSLAVGACTVATLLVFLTACDPGHTVTIVNKTPYTLTVFDDDAVMVREVAPFGTTTGPQKKFLWKGRITAKTKDGRVVFQVDLTWDELKAQDWRIVIEEQGSPPQ